MNLPKFTEIISFSNQEIEEKILEIETEIFNLRFQKATKQDFKVHQLKHKKHRLAQLKTLLMKRLKEIGNKQESRINQLISK